MTLEEFRAEVKSGADIPSQMYTVQLLDQWIEECNQLKIANQDLKKGNKDAKEP